MAGKKNEALKLENILERDVDLMLLEELNVSPEFVRWFIIQSQCKMPVDKIEHVTARHSVSNENGESDLELSYQVEGKDYIILIENKIDAPAQKDQAKRYQKRADSLDCAQSSVVLIAPLEYIQKSSEKYTYNIAYEAIADFFSKSDSARGTYRAELLKNAIDKTRRGYVAKRNDAVTAFWQGYYTELGKIIPDAKMPFPETKPMDSDWPQIKFDSLPRGWYIQHKMSQGHMDMVTTLSGEETNCFREMSESVNNFV